MENNHVLGDLIKRLRKQKGLTQEELAGSKSALSTISRIENGSQIPSKQTFDYLINKLGENAERYYSILFSAADFEISEMIYEIKQALNREEIEKAKKVIAEAESMEGFRENLSMQFLLSSKAIIKMAENENPDEIHMLLEKAIRITIPDFDESKIKELPLIFNEIVIVNKMATLYAIKGDMQKSTDLFFALKTCMERHYISAEERSKMYPTILYNLTKNLGLLERYDEASELCDIAKRECIRYSDYDTLPYITVNKACCLYVKGDKITSKQLFHQAYHTFLMMDRFKEAKQTQDNVKKEFKINIK